MCRRRLSLLVVPDQIIGEASVSSVTERSPKSNGKVLLLDPIEGSTFTVEHLKQAQQLIYQKTQIRGYNTKLLPRGGMMLKFSNSRAKDVCEKLLRENMTSIRPPRETWISRKTSFEVILRNVPDSLDKNVFMEIDANIRKVLDIKHGRVVLFMSSLRSASNICDQGIWIHDMFFGASPYSFTPRMYCKDCGRVDHKSCLVKKCFKCGEVDHVGAECPKVSPDLPPFCVHCTEQGHYSRSCPLVKEKTQPALKRKQKTYADALKKLAYNGPGSKKILQRTSERKMNMYERDSLIRSVLQVVFQIFKIDIDSDETENAIEAITEEIVRAQKSRNVQSEQRHVSFDEEKTTELRTQKPVRTRDDVVHPSPKALRKPEESSDDEIEAPARKGKKTSQKTPQPLYCSCEKDYTKCTQWSSKNHQVTCSCGIVYSQKKAFLAHLKNCSDVIMESSC